MTSWAVFVDTSGWMSCVDESEVLHRESCRARDAVLREKRFLVTTDYVIDETLTIIRMRLGLPIAREWWNQVEKSERVRFEAIGATRADKARALFFKHRDKQFSFTDCTSFVVMQELGLQDALTTDHHFRQMRFTMLPISQKRR